MENNNSSKNYWEGRNFAFFCNDKCEYFPCHKGVEGDFNCLFCYCPLYALGSKCGGNFSFTANGIKDCSACALPHIRENYGYVTGKFLEIAEIIKKTEGK